MRFIYLGTQYHLGFMYPEKQKGQNPHKCVDYLKDDSDNSVISQGESNCNPADNYKYDKGRGIALGRLLGQKEIRDVAGLNKACGLIYNNRRNYSTKIPTVVAINQQNHKIKVIIAE